MNEFGLMLCSMVLNESLSAEWVRDVRLRHDFALSDHFYRAIIASVVAMGQNSSPPIANSILFTKQ
jgi:hypothetical protein